MRALRRRYGHARKARAGQIVIAWRVPSVELVDPHLTRVDLGERHKTRATVEPRAAMWLRDGSAADVEKAEAHARREREGVERDPQSATGFGHRVFVYPSSEKDPLGRARRDILRGAP